MAGRKTIVMVALALTLAPAGLAASSPDRMAAEAYELFAERATWAKAAGLLVSAATAADPADARAVTWARHAGRAYFAAGRLAKARAAFELAAERALAQGAVEDAANAYLDAALVAVHEENGTAARGLADRARLLSGSPHLSVEAREAILSRIG